MYSGKCRNLSEKEKQQLSGRRLPAKRIMVENREIFFYDGHFGRQECNLLHDCGDFVIRRFDGNFSYQLAVVVDDSLMGVSEVVRGRDLIASTFEQLYLYEKIGCNQFPKFFHIPLLLGSDGHRLSKRDKDIDMSFLRNSYTKEELIGKIMFLCGCQQEQQRLSLDEALAVFDWKKMRHDDILFFVA